MECFKYPFVGLKGICCESEKPKSGYYVNGLSGVDFKRFSTAAGGEDLTGANLFKKLHEEAKIRLISDFSAALSEMFTFNYISDEVVVGNLGTDIVNYPYRVGKRVENQSDDETMPRIDWIKFYSDRDINKYLYIETECGTEKIPICVKCGINKIRINKKVPSIATIWIEGCNLGLGAVEGCDKGCGTCGSCAQACCDVCGVVTSVVSEDEGETWRMQSNGIQVKVSCVSCPETLICEYEDKLGLAFRYGIVLQLAESIIQSPDVHPLVRNGKQDAQRWQIWYGGGEDLATGKEYKGLYVEEIERVSKAAAEHLKSIKHGKTLTCKGIRIVETKP